MTSPVLQRWIEIVDSGRIDGLDRLLAEDAVFFSPAVFRPQEGRAQVVAYLTAALKLFGDSGFHYVEQWHSERSAILEFEADVAGIYVNGIDMLHWNDHGQIVSVKVMIRPVKALQAIIPKMAELLGQS
ncbi:nuclear transport factor 2 family protein [Mycobacterium kansasii]|uniref:SnoaL-like domain protein n=2 Tax=Mycobacterium kansasii TaxID=1768 RepID=A0A1V3X164_MYCKA|nr:nuclear transport factor 2 family protein [Mycobacterium kansasii]EUA04433.1 snoaL-like domain protein [Mycobacterium kansasii 824]AGZ51247.1 polyketide cyclase [Mycobacterium kansasii ATCC 12478]ARG56988.1 polyketide cyclase [Mycobacterium kansasii]ARG62501.1 polyketide cyclase [Mycobacterium kansasii]ARG70128.1 polyketide cyclase [Mycobacterium kansasii]